MMVRTAGLIGAVALGSGLLSACTYYEPPPVSYAYVPCPPGSPEGAPSAPPGAASPPPPPSGAAPPPPGGPPQAAPPPGTAPPPAATNAQCVVAVQNYAYPGPYYWDYPYYPYPYYYPPYYPPVSVGVGVGFGFGGHHH